MRYTTESKWQQKERTRKGLLLLAEIGLGAFIGLALAYMLFLGIPDTPDDEAVRRSTSHTSNIAQIHKGK